jgi:uncharacterized protein YjdB
MANLLLMAAFAAVFASCRKDVEVTGVTLDKKMLSLVVGNEETLKATVAPDDAADKTVTWTSSTPGVASVAGGIVTAVAKGRATITVSTVNGKTDACAVTVNSAFVPATGVTLDRKTLMLMVGDRETLTATIDPGDATDKTVKWTSSAPEVATVADGIVTAVAKGTVTITVSTANGKTDICAVTVNSASVPATGVTLDRKTLMLVVGDEETLTATVDPGDATDKTVRWSSSAPEVASVAAGISVGGCI